MLLAEQKKVNLKWVGLVSFENYTSEDQKLLREGLEKHGAYPVFLDHDTLTAFTQYYDYVMTPIFHNFVSYKKNPGVGEEKLLAAYEQLNRAVVEVVLSVLKKLPQAMILFNDPYFLLAPKMLSDLDPKHYPEVASAHMGYFIHTPFPSCEIFRIFPQSIEVIFPHSTIVPRVSAVL
jgi:trehalose-6-phosphate synthase